MKKYADKYPYIDPSERGIFDRIPEVAAEMRRERSSQVAELIALRRENQERALHEMRQREIEAEKRAMQHELRARFERFKVRPVLRDDDAWDAQDVRDDATQP